MKSAIHAPRTNEALPVRHGISDFLESTALAEDAGGAARVSRSHDHGAIRGLVKWTLTARRKGRVPALHPQSASMPGEAIFNAALVVREAFDQVEERRL